MSQKTYQLSKLLIQINIVDRIESLCSGIISLANAKSLFKINFGHKIFYLLTDFQNFCCTYYNKFSAKNCWGNILPPSKESINLQKFILRSQNIHIRMFFRFLSKSVYTSLWIKWFSKSAVWDGRTACIYSNILLLFLDLANRSRSVCPGGGSGKWTGTQHYICVPSES